LSVGRVDPRVGLSWVGNGPEIIFKWVGLYHESISLAGGGLGMVRSTKIDPQTTLRELHTIIMLLLLYFNYNIIGGLFGVTVTMFVTSTTLSYVDPG